MIFDFETPTNFHFRFEKNSSPKNLYNTRFLNRILYKIADAVSLNASVSDRCVLNNYMKSSMKNGDHHQKYESISHQHVVAGGFDVVAAVEYSYRCFP